MPAPFVRTTVTIANPSGSFKLPSHVEAFSGRGMVVVGSGHTPIARIHGSYARNGLGPAELASAVGRHLIGVSGVDPQDLSELVIASSVPDVSHTFLPTTVRHKLGLHHIVNPRHLGTLCTGGASAIVTVIHSLEARGGGIGMALGADDQSLGTIFLDNRFRRILAEVTGKDLPMRFDLDWHGSPGGMIPPEQFVEAVRLFLDEFGSTAGVVQDGILESFRDPSGAGFMWETAARVAQAFGVTDEEAVQIALRSHQGYWQAADGGTFNGIVVTVPGANLTVDENPRRDASPSRLARGRTAPGVHSGTSSQMGGGASGALIASAEYARERGLPILAEIIGYSFSSVDPGVMGLGPVSATKGLLDYLGLSMDQMGHVEINEAFAGIVSAFLKFPDFGFGYDGAQSVFPPHVNPWGGAIAKGHVMGSKFLEMVNLGTRFFELNPDKEYCLITLCGGGGQGAAMVLRNPGFTTKTESIYVRGVTTLPLVEALNHLGYLYTDQLIQTVSAAIEEAREKKRPLPSPEDLEFVLKRNEGQSIPAAELLKRATEIATIRSQGQPGRSETIGQMIGVVGAGEMGHQLALDYARAGYEVHMSDRSLELSEKGRERIVSTLMDAVKRGLYTAEEAAQCLARIHLSDSMVKTVEGIQGEGRKFEMIIEAATEVLKYKRDIFLGERDPEDQEHIVKPGLRQVVDPSTILATNSSSLTAGECGADAVFHYANPVHARFVIDGSFAETVEADKRTGFEERLRAVAFNTRKAYYPAKKDAPGSIFNPIFVSAYTVPAMMLPGIEAAITAEARLKGITIEDPRPLALALLEGAYAKELGLNLKRDGMGAFRLFDVTGGPKVSVECADNVAKFYGDNFRAPASIRNQLKDWEEGRKWNWLPADQQKYAEFVETNTAALETQLGREFVDGLRKEFREHLWTSLMTMTGLMHDKGVIDDPELLDNAVGIALMWRNTPEAHIRQEISPWHIGTQIGSVGGIAPAYFRQRDFTPPPIAAVKLARSADGKMARLSFNRPRVLNAVDEGVIGDLRRISEELRDDEEAAVIVLDGVGKAFVAGADLKWFADRQAESARLRAAGQEEAALAELAKIYDGFSAIEIESMARLRDPERLTVAVLQGDTVGGGVEIAAQADIVIFAENLEGGRAHCWMPEASLGIGIGYGAHVELARKVGVAHAKRILLTGQAATFGPAEGLAMGFANKIVRRDQLQKVLAELAGAWGRIRGRIGRISKEDFIRRWTGERPAAPASVQSRLATLEKLWGDPDAVRVMALGMVPPWLEGDEKKLAEREVTAIRVGAPKAIALLNRMVDEGEDLDLRSGLIAIFDTPDARAAIGAFAAGKRPPSFRWPSARVAVAGITAERGRRT